MNQILKPDINIFNKKENNKNKSLYKLLFIFSSIIALYFLIIFFLHIIKLSKNEKISNSLINRYQVSTLYSNIETYSAEKQEKSETLPFVIGIIKIDKINLNYPILSETSKDLLDVSVCRFSGPMPNEIRQFVHCWT